jgi:hypothetical protein
VPSRKIALVVLGIMAWPAIALAQQIPASSKPRSPGEIARASRVLAEKNENCRRQAREQKLTLLKRRQFIGNCVKDSK